MATAGDGRASYENICKSLFRPEINEDAQDVYQEAGQNNSAGALKLSTHQGGNPARNSADTGKSEVEQTLKQMTFTRAEAKRLIALVHSRTIEESPSSVLRLEASTTSDSLQKLDNGDKSDNFHATIVNSRVVDEGNASPAELAKAYKRSTSSTDQSPRQDSKLIGNIASSLSNTPMASPQQPATMENLPDELLSNIFIRLLAKHLAQMRSVSKSWNALLSRSSFIEFHLNCSVHNNDHILLVFYEKDGSSSDSKQFTAHSCRSPHFQLTDFIKLPVNPQPESTDDIRVIGSVNGLICSSYNDSIIHISNPSLSAVLTLPPYSMPCYGYDSIKIYFRFGFDPKTDDYKVVKLTGFTGLPEHAVTWWMDVEIYSMRKGSWKLVIERFPSHITGGLDEELVCVDGHDGHLHWIGQCVSKRTCSDTIIAFDLGSETFSEILLPDTMLDYYGCFNFPGVLAGKLFVITQFEDGTCEVWVMEEYGVAESWVKRHVFSQFNSFAEPYGFTSHNEFLLDNNGCLVLYDPVSNKTEILENLGPRECVVNKIVEYVDSLCWVAPADNEIVDGARQI